VADTIHEILHDLGDSLRGTDAFASVTVGPDPDGARWPRAEVLFASADDRRPDDRSDGRWTTLRATVRISVRSSRPGDALGRALGLAGSAQEAILADRFRGQRCRDLPVGRATELGPVQTEPRLKPPHLAVSFEVRCHFETEGSE